MSEQTLQIPHIDARKQTCITDEQSQFFLENGFLVVRNAVAGEELKLIQKEMMKQVEFGAASRLDDPDYMYGKGTKSGRPVLRRIEYVIDKSDPMKVLLGNPFILRSVEKLQGPSFVPTWDSMVLKMPDEGIVVPWHRDGVALKSANDQRPIFNVDFYLDDADIKSCLWVIPGSNKWSDGDAKTRCAREGFDTSDAIPVPMKAGDVIFHDITVLHGSPSGDGNSLRRTVYYEFRAGDVEREYGPHIPEYIPCKQQVLLACIKRRSEAPYIQGETPYVYAPEGDLAIRDITPPSTFRYAHEDYWRAP